MRVAVSCLLASLIFRIDQAHACSVVVDHPPARVEREDNAKRRVANSVAIVDGEVVEPATVGRPATIRVIRAFKGATIGEMLQIWETNSCDHRLNVLGERMRMLIDRDDDKLHVDASWSNDAAEDAILRSDRRQDFPFYGGDPRPWPMETFCVVARKPERHFGSDIEFVAVYRTDGIERAVVFDPKCRGGIGLGDELREGAMDAIPFDPMHPHRMFTATFRGTIQKVQPNPVQYSSDKGWRLGVWSVSDISEIPDEPAKK